MNRHIIRTSETDSVKGIPSKQYIDVNLKQTTKSLPFPNVSTTISQRNLYEEERKAGNKFRFILTIVPYCSNVLFNALTEIIKNEGSDEVEVVTDERLASIDDRWDINKKYGVYGRTKPTRVHMICDTEYSSPLHGGYKYHPGYDFFDNHILRNKSFKIVNVNKGNDTDVFNTLSDFTRDINGNKKKYVRRLSIDEADPNKNKHLYLHDDILKIDESINQNLYEENGWWGFNNNTSIDTKELNNGKMWESMDTCKALNDYNSCEFIDMYPDRTLFSFTPKFNNYTKEQENNWNVVITYPYKNVYDHPICFGGSSYIKRTPNSEGTMIEEAISEGNRWMGLKVMSAKLGSGKAGGNNLIFRTYTKHGLSQKDMFYLYYTNPYIEPEEGETNRKYGDETLDGSETYYETQTYYTVTNIGDLNRDNDDYYFYTSNLGLVKEIYKSYLGYVAKLLSDGVETTQIPLYEYYEKDKDKKDIYDEDGVLKTELINKILSQTNFRIRRCVKGVKSTYYIRLLRKIPNLRAAQREMTDEEKLHRSKFNGVFENYISENALDPNNPKYQRLVNNEQYQMAFASNIFNDNITQITFSDGINIEGLTDNLGRPLSEIFYTIVKNNAGHEVWYNEDEPIYSNKDLKTKYGDKKKDFRKKYDAEFDGYKIEYSHCFSKITSGLEMYFRKDDTEQDTGPYEYLKKLSSAHHISNIVNIGNLDTNEPIQNDTDSKVLDDNITYRDTFFYGDLVEFNMMDFKETVLSNVMHRFNTAQRELINNKHYSQYQFHEITQDDYDLGEFNVTEYSAVNGQPDSGMTTKDYQTIGRPEGYIYKANYSIPIREYTRIKQDSHYTLRVRNAKPVQKGGILIQVTTMLAHNLNENDVVFICDDDSDTVYITQCVNVIDRTKFLMSPNYTEVIMNATDIDSVETISNFTNSLYTPVENNNTTRYKTRLSWLELCEILNGKYVDDLTHPKLILRRKNTNIPDYATYIGGNRYIWRDIVNIGDSRAQELPDYIFANGYFYVTNRINFFLKRQDPFGVNGLYFDGERNYPFFPNDPSGVIQKENNFIVKDTNVIC